MTTTSLRAYLRELRQIHDITQHTLAVHMGIAARTLVTWELGATDDIKARPLARAIRALGGTMDDAYQLLFDDAATAHDGQELARQRVLVGGTDSLDTMMVVRAASGPVPLTVVGAWSGPAGTMLDQVRLPFAVRNGTRTYEGIRDPHAYGPQVLVDGAPFSAIYHAATGSTLTSWAWGFVGHAPSALAGALLHYECGLPPDHATGAGCTHDRMLHTAIGQQMVAWVATWPRQPGITV